MTFPVYIPLGPLQLHPHLVFELLAYTIGFQLMLRQARTDTLSFSQRISIFVGGLLGAVIGAKVLVVFQHVDLIQQGWQPLFLLFLQGKTIVGGLLGGLIGVELAKKSIGVSRSTGDLFVFPLIIGVAIGRIGCFLTGLSDKTYGVATTLPWGVDFGDGLLRHPTQLYEVIFLLALASFLLFRQRYSHQEGDLFRFFMVGYLAFRFVIDFIKPDFHILFGLSAIQIACLLGLIYYRKSIIGLFQFNRINPLPSPPPRGEGT